MNEIIENLIKNVVKSENFTWGVRIYTKLANDPYKKWNGGDYDYYTDIITTHDFRVRIKEGWSCDLADYIGIDEVFDVNALEFHIDFVIAILEHIYGRSNSK